MTDEKCPFCGSEKTMIDTPYIDRVTGEYKKTFCCKSMKKNYDFVNKRYDPIYGDAPDPVSIAKE